MSAEAVRLGAQLDGSDHAHQCTSAPEHKKSPLESTIDPAVSRVRRNRVEEVSAWLKGPGVAFPQLRSPKRLIPVFNVQGRRIGCQMGAGPGTR
jgi:hypothetical protein